MVAVGLTLQTAPAAPPAPPPPSPPTVWTDDRPITRIAQNLAHDVKTLPRVESAAIVTAGLFGALIAHGADDDVAAWSRRQLPSSYSGVGSAFGDALVQGGGALGTYVAGKLAHRADVAHIGGDLIRAQMLNGVMTTTIKFVGGRTRPSGGRHAFPSGHTAATFASATVLQHHFGWKAGVPAYAAAGFVGWTRLRDNQHWVSDVVFGSALGLLAGRTIGAAHRPASWRIGPATTTGGVGIAVVRIR